MHLLLDAGDIIVDPRDDNILVTRVTNEKLQELHDKSVSISDLRRKKPDG